MRTPSPTNALERAAELTGIPTLRTQRLAAAGSAAWLAGQTERALDLLDRALARTPDPRLRAHIQEVRGAVETRCGSLDDALATLMGAAAGGRGVRPRHGDPALLRRHPRLLLPRARRRLRCVPAPRSSGSRSSSVDPNARVLGAMASGMALVLSGAGAQGIERLRGSASSLVDPNDVSDGRFRHPLRTQGSLWLREAGQVRDAGQRGDRAPARARRPRLTPPPADETARDGATADRWDDAEAGYLEAIRLAGETGQSTDFAVCLSGLAVLNARRGRAQECRENIAAAAEVARRNNIRMASVLAGVRAGRPRGRRG